MSFIDRHLGPRSADAEQMLETLGYSSLDALMDAVVPSQIRLDGELQLPAPLSEHEAQAKIAGYAAKNKVLAQMIWCRILRCSNSRGSAPQYSGKPRFLHFLHPVPG